MNFAKALAQLSLLEIRKNRLQITSLLTKAEKQEETLLIFLEPKPKNSSDHISIVLRKLDIKALGAEIRYEFMR
jgi:hypothetical protein